MSDENRKRVAELEQAGRWDELARFAEQNLAKDRGNADWWLVAGYARSQLGQHREAADAYGEAVRLEPDNIAAWNLLAQAYRAAGEPRRAVNALNNALTATRDSPVTFFLLGESYTDLRRYEEAAAAYREAVRRTHFRRRGLRSPALTRGSAAREAGARRLERLDPKLAAPGRIAQQRSDVALRGAFFSCSTRARRVLSAGVRCGATSCRISPKTFGVPPTMWPLSIQPSLPSRSPTRPPASVMRSEPAAMSHGLKPSSQKPSSRPAATYARSSAAEPGAAHAGRVLHHVAQNGHVRVEVRELFEWKTGADEARLQVHAFAHAYARVVEVGAASAAGGVEVVARRIIDDGLRHDAAMLERDGDCILREAVQKVRRAVERIDDPAVFGRA